MAIVKTDEDSKVNANIISFSKPRWHDMYATANVAGAVDPGKQLDPMTFSN